MKKQASKSPKSSIRQEYDFSRGVRGKWAASYAEGTKVVLIAPDLAKVFRTSKQVNDALRALVAAKIRKQRPRRPKLTA